MLSLPSLPHYRKLQLRLSSGKQLTIQLDQGLSYWDTDRREKNYQLKFDFAVHDVGAAIMESIQCRLAAASNENTQIFISATH